MKGTHRTTRDANGSGLVRKRLIAVPVPVPIAVASFGSGSDSEPAMWFRF